MSRPNVFTDELQDMPGAAGFGARLAPVGMMAGAQRLGASVYSLEPGQCPFPYHFHRNNEEMLVVLQGRPTLRGPDGERELAEGSLVAFPPGPRGAHQLINRSGETVRYVMLSTRYQPEMVHYPDSGKVACASPPQDGDPPAEGPVRFVFFERDAAGYYEGEEAPS